MNHIVEQYFCKVQKGAILLSKKLLGSLIGKCFLKKTGKIKRKKLGLAHGLRLIIQWVQVGILWCNIYNLIRCALYYGYCLYSRLFFWIRMEAPNPDGNLNLKLIVIMEMHFYLLRPWTETILAQQLKLFCKNSHVHYKSAQTKLGCATLHWSEPWRALLTFWSVDYCWFPDGRYLVIVVNAYIGCNVLRWEIVFAQNFQKFRINLLKKICYVLQYEGSF